MTHLSSISTIGKAKNFDLLTKHEYEFSFKMTLRNGAIFCGDSLTWRQELFRSLDAEEAAYTVECLAQSIWMIGKLLEAKITELWAEPQPVLLQLHFAYGAVIDARLVYGENYLEQESLDALERLLIGNFVARANEIEYHLQNWR